MFREFAGDAVLTASMVEEGGAGLGLEGVREAGSEGQISRVSRDLIDVEMALFHTLHLDPAVDRDSPSILPGLANRTLDDTSKLGDGIAQEFLRFESLLYSGYMSGYINKRDLGLRYVKNMTQLNQWLEDKWLKLKNEQVSPSLPSFPIPSSP